MKPELEKIMRDKSTDYIDWEELYYGDQDKSGSAEAAAFCDGFKFALKQLGLADD